MVNAAIHIDGKIRVYHFYTMKELDLFRKIVFGLLDIRGVQPPQKKRHGSR